MTTSAGDRLVGGASKGDRVPEGVADACELVGDARVHLVAPLEFSDAFEELPASWQELDAAELASTLDERLGAWRAEMPRLDYLTAGSATFQQRMPSGVRVYLRHVAPGAVGRQLRGCLPGTAEVERIEALVFNDATISVHLELLVEEGWERDAAGVRGCLGPETRDAVCDAIRLELERELGSVVEALTSEPRDARLPYFHLLYVGSSSTPLPGLLPLSESLRALLYTDDVGPVTSASPQQDEFVHAGYAFSLLATGSDHPCGESVADRYVVLIQLAQYLYRRVARTCDDIEGVMRSTPSDERDLDQLWYWEFKLQEAVHAFLTPTFSFDHSVLVVRDRLLAAWRLTSLLERTSFLVRNLELGQSRRRDRREHKRQRLLAVLIALVTALSLAEIIDAGVSLYDRFVVGVVGG